MQPRLGCETPRGLRALGAHAKPGALGCYEDQLEHPGCEWSEEPGSQRRTILEGSQEWDILYRKYYNEEVKRLGI